MGVVMITAYNHSYAGNCCCAGCMKAARWHALVSMQEVMQSSRKSGGWCTWHCIPAAHKTRLWSRTALLKVGRGAASVDPGVLLHLPAARLELWVPDGALINIAR